MSVERTAETVLAAKRSTPGLTFSNNTMRGLKVLCVDNDQSVLLGLSGLLQQWECQVMTASSSAQALEKIDKQGLIPEIVLMDYHLNEETGVEAILKIREKLGRNLAAVLVTAERSRSLKREVDEMRLAIIYKPVKPAALRSVLASVRRIWEAAE